MEDAADPDKAPKMQAYMKTVQPFYGVQTTERRNILRDVIADAPVRSRVEYDAVVLNLWGGVYREEMYLALDIAERVKAYRDLDSFPLYERLIHESPNWDTLDAVIMSLVSPLVMKHRELEAKLIEWSDSDNFWVRRASLLGHVKHRAATNTELLSATILKLADEKEFFIRKAIGWVLREYSKTDPDWVRAFVAAHDAELSPLSKREALRRIPA